MHRWTATLALAVSVAASTAVAAQHAMPPGMSHEEHLAQIKKEAELKRRGADAMGFDQDATTHHFRLFGDGGAIEVDANDVRDEKTRQEVRAHLRQIAEEFSRGVFERPFRTHAEVPSGVPAMQTHRATIRYTFEETRRGARIRITSANAEAVAAIHEFLRYQIREHATGDPLTVTGAQRFLEAGRRSGLA